MKAQQSLLNQARQKLLEESRTSAQAEIFSQIKAAELVAASSAQEFLESHPGICTLDQAKLVNFTLGLDESLGKEYFNKLSDNDRKETIKTFKITLHPDKNKHPDAKQAFQKLQTFLD